MGQAVIHNFWVVAVTSQELFDLRISEIYSKEISIMSENNATNATESGGYQYGGRGGRNRRGGRG